MIYGIKVVEFEVDDHGPVYEPPNARGRVRYFRVKSGNFWWQSYHNINTMMNLTNKGVSGCLESESLPAAMRGGFSVYLGPTPAGQKFVAVGESPEAAAADGRITRQLQVRVVGDHKFAGPETAAKAAEHVNRLREDPAYSSFEISAEFNGPGMSVHRGSPWNNS